MVFDCKYYVPKICKIFIHEGQIKIITIYKLHDVECSAVGSKVIKYIFVNIKILHANDNCNSAVYMCAL